jgi:peptidoglycan-associated lipoprotein
MYRVASSLRAGRVAFVVLFALAVAACGRGGDDLGGGAVAVGGATGPGSIQEFQVTVGDRVFFDTDSSELSAQARATLDRQAQWLVLYPQYQIIIEGHADERGTREYNIALSGRRASAVQTYLASRGVPLARMSTIPYGKERPVATCNDISCWSQNRRAVTVLTGFGAGV